MRVRNNNVVYDIIQAKVIDREIRFYYISTSQSGSYNGYGGGLSIRYLSIIAPTPDAVNALLDTLYTQGYVDVSSFDGTDSF